MLSIPFFEEAGDAPLLTHGGRTWTRTEFLNEVQAAQDHVSGCSGLADAGRDFLLLDTEDPVLCYSYLLALVDAGKRVILPNRDHFSGSGEPITFSRLVVTPEQTGVSVREHPGFVSCDVPEAGDVIVFSSGSTGKPKGIVHDFDHFIQNAQDTARTISGEGFCSITYLKPYLVSAVSHFLCHFMKGGHLVFADFADFDQLPELAAKHPGAGLVGSPFHIASGLNVLPEEHAPHMFFSSGDMLPAATIERGLARFPGTTFYYVYGLAELAGRFFVHPLTAEDARCPESVGRAIAGCEYRIKDGRVLVKSPYLFHGYVIEGRYVPSEQWHDSGDMAVEGECGVVLHGRSNDEVKVLGNKVNIRYLENKIQNALRNDKAYVVPMQDERFGTLLALAVADRSLDRAGIMAQLKTSLETKELPHSYHRLESIPFTQTMKVDRKKIAEQLPDLEKL